MQIGTSRVLTSDQGTEFHNQIKEELMTLLKVDHRLSTAYHPQVHKYGGIRIELCYLGIKRYILYFIPTVGMSGSIKPFS